MSIAQTPQSDLNESPNHRDLPCEDGIPVNNAQEPSQSRLLTSSFKPLLPILHPANDYFIGEDVGIYWRLTNPPLQGARSPDWYYVPGVQHQVEGVLRRSYVMWQEKAPVYLAIEYASGDGSEERDNTPDTGKFWVYENHIRPAFYAIFNMDDGSLEAWRMKNNRFQLMKPNKHGRYAFPKMKVELGVWHGEFEDYTGRWLRWWDESGKLLPAMEEIAEREKQRADTAEAELARVRAEIARENQND